MIKSVAFIKRILVCFEPDYSSSLPVPSEDDNPEDGYQVDKIKAGRVHWDWLQGLHSISSRCNFLLFLFSSPGRAINLLCVVYICLSPFSRGQGKFLHLIWTSHLSYVRLLLQSLPSFRVSCSDCHCRLHSGATWSLSTITNGVTFDMSYVTLMVFIVGRKLEYGYIRRDAVSALPESCVGTFGCFLLVTQVGGGGRDTV